MQIKLLLFWKAVSDQKDSARQQGGWVRCGRVRLIVLIGLYAGAAFIALFFTLKGTGTASLDELSARHAEWLSQTFNLPLISAEANLEQSSAEELVALRYGTLRRGSMDAPTSVAPATPDPRSTVAVYVANTIYLSKAWTGRTPADLSVLVHEMVHHIQNVGNIHDECPRAREKLAYAAQQRFLQIYERDLETEFEINPFTVLVNTTCGY